MPGPPFQVAEVQGIPRKFQGNLAWWNITPLKTNEYPLKIDGWKMHFPFKIVLFQGTFVYFRGSIIWSEMNGYLADWWDL